jgi:hypothetical protein
MVRTDKKACSTDKRPRIIITRLKGRREGKREAHIKKGEKRGFQCLLSLSGQRHYRQRGRERGEERKREREEVLNLDHRTLRLTHTLGVL